MEKEEKRKKLKLIINGQCEHIDLCKLKLMIDIVNRFGTIIFCEGESQLKA